MNNIGSHNTMTYLPPKNILFNIFKWTYKCQSLPIADQFNLGIRIFDLRIKQDKSGNWVFAHGIVQFKRLNFFDILNILKKYDNIKVRLLWEIKKEQNESPFIELCQYIEKEYPNIQFFEGRRKFDWKCVYNFHPDNSNFDSPSLATEQYVGSMQSFYGKIWPWLWTKLNRKKSRKLAKSNNSEVILLDFIQKNDF